MSPVPKSPISREESSQKDDSKTFKGFGNNFGGINLEVANVDANQQHNMKSKSQHVKDHNDDPLAESFANNEPKKTLCEVGITKQETRLERVSEKDSDDKEQQP